MARRLKLDRISAEARADIVSRFKAERKDGIGFSTTRIIRELSVLYGCSESFVRVLLIEKGVYTTDGWNKKTDGLKALTHDPYRHDLTTDEEYSVAERYKELSDGRRCSYPICWNVARDLKLDFQKVINYVKFLGWYVQR